MVIPYREGGYNIPREITFLQCRWLCPAKITSSRGIPMCRRWNSLMSSCHQRCQTLQKENSIPGFYQVPKKIHFTPERGRLGEATHTWKQSKEVWLLEMSMDDSPSYGSFTTLMKEGSSEEQMKVTPVRRSNRLRNQKKSPLSAVRTISKWRSCIMFFLRATWFEHREKHEQHKEFFLQMTLAFTWLFLSKS